jgi:DNA-binding MarR family transcriptional regulator
VRDAGDRRRVLVELTPEAFHGAGDFYSEHIALAERNYRRYTERELELLLGFVREGRELNEREAAKLEAQTRSERAS